ncbi:hypothetical protein MD535_24455 [Vibrio sp. ZSDZ65]|uniref:Uncharacterized protein n=1 Tax=Vibrio qingdaonensis TaxID=2829491 RepID=A0A9X3CTG8_9VIBR|nr:hypothetical protein [Vibrio qingdaonensis]MCW8349143.1 hypothetical protein [Vibrio qingdaonensis]
MSVLTYCKIEEMTVSPKMLGYLNRIESKVDFGNLLAGSVAATQFIELFSGRVSTGKRLKAIYEHDWDSFGQAMMSTHRLTRNEVNKVADEARVYSSYMESKFWSCVYEATR